jgi:hypothetical protein
MRKDSENRTDRPTLVVTYGNTNQRQRQLEGDLVVLGRARNCDITLVSPEVANVHCIIARVGGGWRLRDCTGRGGTRLNGTPVTDVELTDADVLQVGTFSFEVKLPAAKRGDSRVDKQPGPGNGRLERSRRNLAHLALGLRKRLRVAEAALRPQEEIDRQSDRLRVLQRECEARRQQHEQAESSLRAQRDVQEREQTARREQLDRAAQEAAQRQAEEEARLQAQRQELEELRRQEQEGHARRVEELRQLGTTVVPPAEGLGELERAGRRLARFARKLQRDHQKLRQLATGLASGAAPTDPAAAGPEPESEQLRLEVEELRLRLAELQVQCAAQEKELTALRALEDAQAAFVELSGGAQMQQLICSLRQQVKDRDDLLERMNEKLAGHSHPDRPEAEDMAGYEAELNQYRVELERDRHDLNDQMKQVQEREQEMQQALREAELQMARERAQLAREQAELNRLRMELGRATNRKSREIAARKRLAGVQRLKEEMLDKRPDGEPEPANAGRLRSLLNKLTGSSA